MSYTCLFTQGTTRWTSAMTSAFTCDIPLGPAPGVGETPHWALPLRLCASTAVTP